MATYDDQFRLETTTSFADGVDVYYQYDVINATTINSVTHGHSNSNHSAEQSAWLHATVANIRLAFLPIVVAGTITNVLNFVVLSHHEMRSVSTSVYLFALAVADLGVMYLELFRVWFEMRRFVELNDTYCRLVNFANGIVRDYSNWLIACVTLERLAMVARPYIARNYCTPQVAKRVACGLFVAIALTHIHCLIFSQARFDSWWVCWQDPDSSVGRTVVAIFDVVVGFVVVVIVFILNVRLSWLIYGNRLPAGGPATSMAPSSSSSLTSYKRKSHNKRLTRTLLVVAIVFVVCETPRILVSMIVKLVEKTPIRRIVLNATFALSGINHAANFFIYIVLSPRFRQLLVESLRSAVDSLSECARRCCLAADDGSTVQHYDVTVRRDRHRRDHRRYTLELPLESTNSSSCCCYCCCCSLHKVGDSRSRDHSVQFNLDVIVGTEIE